MNICRGTVNYISDILKIEERVFINKVLDQIPNQSTVFLDIRLSNSPALIIFHYSGFWEIDIRDGYYSESEDAIIMKWNCVHLN